MEILRAKQVSEVSKGAEETRKIFRLSRASRLA